MKRLLDYDPLTGTREVFEATEDGFHVHTTQDVEPILEMNKYKQSLGRAYYANDKDMWRVASIPMIVQHKWLVEHGIRDVTAPEYWPKVRTLLNSSDWRYLKTAEIII